MKNDVIIDMWCYRRYGHNETDDPAFTQPLQSAEIAAHPTVVDLYAKRLIEQNIATEDDVDAMKQAVREKLDAAFADVKNQKTKPRKAAFGGAWQGYGKAGADRTAKTAVSQDLLIDIAQKATTVPEGFHVYRKLVRQLDYRLQMVQGNVPMDWGCAEMLAFGSLLVEGFPVRLAGQDSQRGTFSHRQAVWHDVENGSIYSPLNHLSADQGGFRVYNTMLSELAVLGFEFGVSYANPRKLTIWEAQFGDFANGAQMIIDQFISSSEAKWEKMSGLVMLLPHGFEGQGSRAFECAVRAVSGAVCRRQYAGGLPHAARAVFSFAAPPDAACISQAAHFDDAKEFVAAQRIDLHTRGFVRGGVLSGFGRSRTARSRRGEARCFLHGEGLFRSQRGAGQKGRGKARAGAD